jgi:hypothetical protein
VLEKHFLKLKRFFEGPSGPPAALPPGLSPTTRDRG